MIEIRPFAQLGHFENDWLNARHHFSFGHYHDPARDGLGTLLVWNDDTIAPGRGFDLHGHRDMEIITFVRQGAITHRDHLGNEGRTEAGDVQVMSAGKGILHAEYNQEDEPTRIFQIWIRPQESGVKPRWEQRRFPSADRGGRLIALASGRDDDVRTRRARSTSIRTPPCSARACARARASPIGWGRIGRPIWLRMAAPSR
jgi:redox-sensitive bicupin YhaK (pirin superfamily)